MSNHNINRSSVLQFFVALFVIFSFMSQLSGMRRTNRFFGFGGASKYDDRIKKQEYKKELIALLPKLRERHKVLEALHKADPHDEGLKFEFKDADNELNFIRSELGDGWGKLIFLSTGFDTSQTLSAYGWARQFE